MVYSVRINAIDWLCYHMLVEGSTQHRSRVHPQH